MIGFIVPPRRLVGTWGFRVACLSALLLAAGCSAPDAETAPDPSEAARAAGVRLEAELDPATGAIGLPVEQFLTPRDDSEVLGAAAQVAVAACAAEQGVHYAIPVRATPEEYTQDTLDGPWTVSQAERFGFVQPMTDEDLRGNGIVGAPAAGPTAARTARTLGDLPSDSPDRAVVEACAAEESTTEEFRLVESPTGPWFAELDAAVRKAQTSEAAVTLRGELRACYEQRGIAVDGAAFDSGQLGATAGVTGADPSRIDEQQVNLALEVVACKTQVRYTERAAGLIAQAQAGVVTDHLEEFGALAEQRDAARAKAETILSDHPDLTTSW